MVWGGRDGLESAESSGHRQGRSHGYIQLQDRHLKILRQPFSPPQLGPVYSVRMLGFLPSWQLPGSYNADNINSY